MAIEAEDMAARLLAEFRHALENGQLVAYFQPEVELSSGRVVAAESLARWEHPDLATLPPSLFSPLAEQLGLMGELTRLMLGLALAQQRIWATDGCHIPVSVNVGPDCVADPEFPAVIAGFLRSERVPHQMLTLEVSEQTGTSSVSAGFFSQLAAFGVRVALDDFGTGFASLESLGGWPIDELKLDMSLVRPIANNTSFRTIVRTTIDLAHQLGIKVVAEGVESEAVRFELQALGCDVGQGFLFGRAMSAEAFAGWLREQEQAAPRRGGAGYQIAASAVEAPVAAADRLPAGGGMFRRLARAGRQLTDLVGGDDAGDRRHAGDRLRAVASLPLGRSPASGADRRPPELSRRRSGRHPVDRRAAGPRRPGHVRVQASWGRLLARLRGHRAGGGRDPDRLMAAAARAGRRLRARRRPGPCGWTARRPWSAAGPGPGRAGSRRLWCGRTARCRFPR
jgi:EAL domain-containing protein (putative c-di-GMP-specific phosphodiesterase class I)